jgi:hypothetical protein
MKTELIEKVVPFIKVILMNTTKEKKIYGIELVNLINSRVLIDKPISAIDLRTCINYMRAKLNLPIIAGSNGYYMSEDKEEIYSQIKSLEGRINKLNEAKSGLEFILRKKVKEDLLNKYV